MVGVDKNKLSDLFKKKDDKEEKKKKAKEALSRMKTTAKKKPAKKSIKKSYKQTAPGVYGAKPSKEKLAAAKASKERAEAAAKAKASKEKAVMHSKTHQDLINVAYKAADELKIAPWVLLRAAKWGHLTDDRGKKYDGPMIDEIDTLEPAQKAALKKVLGL